MRQRGLKRIAGLLAAVSLLCLVKVNYAQEPETSSNSNASQSQPQGEKKKSRSVRTVTIPITVRLRKTKMPTEEVPQIVGLGVKEDGEEQRIISVHGLGESSLTLAVLIQDDVVSSINNEIKGIADFIRRLPRGSRVMVGYIRSGSLEVRQKFTTDLERAADSLRITISSSTAAPFNPYVEIIEAIKRFESQPLGRRAMLVISDGVDTRNGLDSSSPGLSIDLQRAINEAQRRSVAIYSFYAPTVTLTAGNNQTLVNNGQGSLDRLAEETGGHAYFQGTGAPVSFDPFLFNLGASLTRQATLTYLSTHPKKGYHRIELLYDTTELEIDYPTGYIYR